MAASIRSSILVLRKMKRIFAIVTNIWTSRRVPEKNNPKEEVIELTHFKRPARRIARDLYRAFNALKGRKDKVYDTLIEGHWYPIGGGFWNKVFDKFGPLPARFDKIVQTSYFEDDLADFFENALVYKDRKKRKFKFSIYDYSKYIWFRGATSVSLIYRLYFLRVAKQFTEDRLAVAVKLAKQNAIRSKIFDLIAFSDKISKFLYRLNLKFPSFSDNSNKYRKLIALTRVTPADLLLYLYKDKEVKTDQYLDLVSMFKDSYVYRRKLPKARRDLRQRCRQYIKQRQKMTSLYRMRRNFILEIKDRKKRPWELPSTFTWKKYRRLKRWRFSARRCYISGLLKDIQPETTQRWSRYFKLRRRKFRLDPNRSAYKKTFGMQQSHVRIINRKRKKDRKRKKSVFRYFTTNFRDSLEPSPPINIYDESIEITTPIHKRIRSYKLYETSPVVPNLEPFYESAYLFEMDTANPSSFGFQSNSVTDDFWDEWEADFVWQQNGLINGVELDEEEDNELYGTTRLVNPTLRYAQSDLDEEFATKQMQEKGLTSSPNENLYKPFQPDPDEFDKYFEFKSTYDNKPDYDNPAEMRFIRESDAKYRDKDVLYKYERMSEDNPVWYEKVEDKRFSNRRETFFQTHFSPLDLNYQHASRKPMYDKHLNLSKLAARKSTIDNYIGLEEPDLSMIPVDRNFSVVLGDGLEPQNPALYDKSQPLQDFDIGDGPSQDFDSDLELNLETSAVDDYADVDYNYVYDTELLYDWYELTQSQRTDFIKSKDYKGDRLLDNEGKFIYDKNTLVIEQKYVSPYGVRSSIMESVAPLYSQHKEIFQEKGMPWYQYNNQPHKNFFEDRQEVPYNNAVLDAFLTFSKYNYLVMQDKKKTENETALTKLKSKLFSINWWRDYLPTTLTKSKFGLFILRSKFQTERTSTSKRVAANKINNRKVRAYTYNGRALQRKFKQETANATDTRGFYGDSNHNGNVYLSIEFFAGINFSLILFLLSLTDDVYVPVFFDPVLDGGFDPLSKTFVDYYDDAEELPRFLEIPLTYAQEIMATPRVIFTYLKPKIIPHQFESLVDLAYKDSNKILIKYNSKTSVEKDVSHYTYWTRKIRKRLHQTFELVNHSKKNNFSFDRGNSKKFTSAAYPFKRTHYSRVDALGITGSGYYSINDAGMFNDFQPRSVSRKLKNIPFRGADIFRKQGVSLVFENMREQPGDIHTYNQSQSFFSRHAQYRGSGMVDGYRNQFVYKSPDNQHDPNKYFGRPTVFLEKQRAVKEYVRSLANFVFDIDFHYQNRYISDDYRYSGQFGLNRTSFYNKAFSRPTGNQRYRSFESLINAEFRLDQNLDRSFVIRDTSFIQAQPLLPDYFDSPYLLNQRSEVADFDNDINSIKEIFPTEDIINETYNTKKSKKGRYRDLHLDTNDLIGLEYYKKYRGLEFDNIDTDIRATKHRLQYPRDKAWLFYQANSRHPIKLQNLQPAHDASEIGAYINDAESIVIKKPTPAFKSGPYKNKLIQWASSPIFQRKFESLRQTVPRLFRVSRLPPYMIDPVAFAAYIDSYDSNSFLNMFIKPGLPNLSVKSLTQVDEPHTRILDSGWLMPDNSRSKVRYLETSVPKDNFKHYLLVNYTKGWTSRMLPSRMTYNLTQGAFAMSRGDARGIEEQIIHTPLSYTGSPFLAIPTRWETVLNQRWLDSLPDYESSFSSTHSTSDTRRYDYLLDTVWSSLEYVDVYFDLLLSLIKRITPSSNTFFLYLRNFMVILSLFYFFHKPFYLLKNQVSYRNLNIKQNLSASELINKEIQPKKIDNIFISDNSKTKGHSLKYDVRDRITEITNTTGPNFSDSTYNSLKPETIGEGGRSSETRRWLVRPRSKFNRLVSLTRNNLPISVLVNTLVKPKNKTKIKPVFISDRKISSIYSYSFLWAAPSVNAVEDSPFNKIKLKESWKQDLSYIRRSNQASKQFRDFCYNDSYRLYLHRQLKNYRSIGKEVENLFFKKQSLPYSPSPVKHPFVGYFFNNEDSITQSDSSERLIEQDLNPLLYPSRRSYFDMGRSNHIRKFNFHNTQNSSTPVRHKSWSLFRFQDRKKRVIFTKRGSKTADALSRVLLPPSKESLYNFNLDLAESEMKSNITSYLDTKGSNDPLKQRALDELIAFNAGFISDKLVYSPVLEKEFTTNTGFLVGLDNDDDDREEFMMEEPDGHEREEFNLFIMDEETDEDEETIESCFEDLMLRISSDQELLELNINSLFTGLSYAEKHITITVSDAINSSKYTFLEKQLRLKLDLVSYKNWRTSDLQNYSLAVPRVDTLEDGNVFETYYPNILNDGLPIQYAISTVMVPYSLLRFFYRFKKYTNFYEESRSFSPQYNWKPYTKSQEYPYYSKQLDRIVHKEKAQIARNSTHSRYSRNNRPFIRELLDQQVNVDNFTAGSPVLKSDHIGIDDKKYNQSLNFDQTKKWLKSKKFAKLNQKLAFRHKYCSSYPLEVYKNRLIPQQTYDPFAGDFVFKDAITSVAEDFFSIGLETISGNSLDSVRVADYHFEEEDELLLPEDNNIYYRWRYSSNEYIRLLVNRPTEFFETQLKPLNGRINSVPSEESLKAEDLNYPVISGSSDLTLEDEDFLNAWVSSFTTTYTEGWDMFDELYEEWELEPDDEDDGDDDDEDEDESFEEAITNDSVIDNYLPDVLFDLALRNITPGLFTLQQQLLSFSNYSRSAATSVGLVLSKRKRKFVSVFPYYLGDYIDKVSESLESSPYDLSAMENSMQYLIPALLEGRVTRERVHSALYKSYIVDESIDLDVARELGIDVAKKYRTQLILLRQRIAKSGLFVKGYSDVLDQNTVTNQELLNYMRIIKSPELNKPNIYRSLFPIDDIDSDFSIDSNDEEDLTEFEWSQIDNRTDIDFLFSLDQVSSPIRTYDKYYRTISEIKTTEVPYIASINSDLSLRFLAVSLLYFRDYDYKYQSDF